MTLAKEVLGTGQKLEHYIKGWMGDREVKTTSGDHFSKELG